jgi:hypothetical protein
VAGLFVIWLIRTWLHESLSDLCRRVQLPYIEQLLNARLKLATTYMVICWQYQHHLVAEHHRAHNPTMFMVTESDAAAICAAYDQSGELAAAVELRRRFKGITDNEKARACVRSIVGWRQPPMEPAASS